MSQQQQPVESSSRQDPNKPVRRKWKRRVVWSITLLILLSTILIGFAFNRFHFSHQLPFGLSHLQTSTRAPSRFVFDKPQIIGHRGCGLSHNGLPPYIGNTERAIEAGIEANADWLEIDIRMSEDGHLVVFHDEYIDEKTNKSGKVADLKLEELQEAEVLVHPREKILTLDEVFAKFYPVQRKWVFDIKMPGIQQEVLKWLAGRVVDGLSKEHIILIGTYDVLQDYRDSGYRLGYTLIWGKFSNRLRVLFAPTTIIDRCEDVGCDYLVLPIIFASDSLVRRATDKNIHVWIYGSDNLKDHDDSSRRGITGLIVDRPADAVKHFAK